jgi:MFS family permease
LGIASGSLALAAIWALYNVFMPLLLAGFLESRAARGAVMGLDNVVAVLLIPVVGAWSDRVRGRWGRRLPFLLVGVPLAALTFAGLPWAATALWSLIALDVAFLLAITLYRAPLVALMPDHVAPDARSVANGAITLMGAVGGVLALVALAPLAEATLGLPFAAAPFAVAAGLALAALAVVVASSDRHPPFVADGTVADDAPSPRAVWRELRAGDAVVALGALPLLVGLFAAFFGFAAVEAQFSAFATEALAVGAGRAGTLLGTASAAFVLVAFPAGAWARRVGERAAMRLGALVLVLALPVAGLLPDGMALSLALVVFGAGWALVVVPAYPLVADLGGRDRVGLLTGLYYLVGSGAAIVAPGVAGLAMDAFGDRALFAVAALAFAAAAWAWGRVPPRRSVGGSAEEGGPTRNGAPP